MSIGNMKYQKGICLNCTHMENMDYIHGCGVCAALEGETVILDEKCICPQNTLEEVESLLQNIQISGTGNI